MDSLFDAARKQISQSNVVKVELKLVTSWSVAQNNKSKGKEFKKKNSFELKPLMEYMKNSNPINGFIKSKQCKAFLSPNIGRLTK